MNIELNSSKIPGELQLSTFVALNSGRELMARARSKLLEISNFDV